MDFAEERRGNVTRRVLAMADRSDSRVALAVGRFGRVKPERMEIVRVEFVRGAKQLSREEFCGQLRGILAVQFPDETPWRKRQATKTQHDFTVLRAEGTGPESAEFSQFLGVGNAPPLYRAQSERWLQSIVQQDVTRTDVSLLTEQVYEQVFAQTAAQHGILDLFGITRAGRHSGIEDRRRSGPGILAPGNGTKSPASAWQNAGVAASA
jgi:hypothetical protein